MKRVTIFLLIIEMFISMLGCSVQHELSEHKETTDIKPEDDMAEMSVTTISDDLIGNYDKQTRYDEGVVINEKSYRTEEKDYLLLQVENISEKNRRVEIVVRYFDVNGDVIEQQAQRYDWFSSGYKKYFLFRPYYHFTEYEYDILVVDTEDPVPVITFEFDRVDIQMIDYGGYSDVVAPVANMRLSLSRTDDDLPTAILAFSLLILDENKDFYDVCCSNYNMLSKANKEADISVSDYFTTGNGPASLDYIDELNTKLTFIPIITYAEFSVLPF